MSMPPFPLATPAARARSAAGPWCDLSLDFQPGAFRVQWASDPWMEAQARELRQSVFCREQGLFDGDDRDAVDAGPARRHTLVALSCLAGEADEVVGTVRIHEAAPGVWWGSRLAVAAAWRRQGRLGGALVRLAVSSARGLGCWDFLAHVQAQNVPLFRRLHWQRIEDRDIHGRAHAWMRADLAHYPPCLTPYAGQVLSTGAER